MNGDFLKKRKAFMQMMAVKWAFFRPETIGIQNGFTANDLKCLFGVNAVAPTTSILADIVSEAKRIGVNTAQATYAAVFSNSSGVANSAFVVVTAPVSIELGSNMAAATDIPAVIKVLTAQAEIMFEAGATVVSYPAKALNLTTEIGIFALQAAVSVLPVSSVNGDLQCILDVTATANAEREDTDAENAYSTIEMALGITLGLTSCIEPTISIEQLDASTGVVCETQCAKDAVLDDYGDNQLGNLSSTLRALEEIIL